MVEDVVSPALGWLVGRVVDVLVGIAGSYVMSCCGAIISIDGMFDGNSRPPLFDP
jgi:hypothetical protein